MSNPESKKQEQETNTATWTCPYCNFSGNTEKCCKVCKNEKPSKEEHTNDVSAFQNMFRQKVKGKWKCTVCQTYNDPKNTKCVSCDADKPGTETDKTNNQGSVNLFANARVSSGFASIKPSIFSLTPATGFNPDIPTGGFTFTFGGKQVSIEANKVSVVTSEKRSATDEDEIKSESEKKVNSSKPSKKRSMKKRRMEISKKRMETIARLQKERETAYEESLIHYTPSAKEIEERKKEEEEFLSDERPEISPLDSQSQYKPLGTENQNYTVFVWGSCELGQLGLGDDISSATTPTELEALTGKNIRRINCGGMHTMAISSGKENTIYSWGANDDSVLGREGDELIPLPVVTKDIRRGERVTQVFAGQCHNVLLTQNGQVYSWGIYRDSKGACDWSSDTHIQPIPRQILFPESDVIIQVACGDNHTLALTRSGKVFGWGINEQGQLGLGRNTRSFKQYSPNVIYVPCKSRDRIVGVYTGSMHSMVLTAEHRIYATGLNNYGQLGLGHRGPVSEFTWVKDMSDKEIIALDGGQHHTLALSKNGKVYGCGRADYGQLGLTTYSPDGEFSYSLIEQIQNIPMQQIACGDCHSISLSTKGDVYCWGFNGLGQIGVQSYDDQYIPKKVQFNNVKSVIGVQISAGGQHSTCLARVIRN